MITSGRILLLVEAADHVARTGGVDPMRNARGMAEAWRRSRPESFRELLLLAGMRPPEDGGVMRRLFLDALDERAEQLGRT